MASSARSLRVTLKELLVLPSARGKRSRKRNWAGERCDLFASDRASNRRALSSGGAQLLYIGRSVDPEPLERRSSAPN
jgi:hypothetical protein